MFVSEQVISKSEIIANNMVVSESSASEVGINVLKKGGNAIDAAIATCFATTLYEPPVSSLGGGGYMTIHIAKTNETIGVEYNGRLPHAITENFWEQLGWLLPSSMPKTGFLWRAVKDNENVMGYKSLGIPGMVSGMCWALDHYGTMTIDEILKPIIRLAEYGWVVNELVAFRIVKKMANILKFPETARYFLKEGIPPAPGDKIIAKELAETLKIISDGGSDAFYKGEIAKKLIRDIRAHGSIVTEEDFSRYEPTIYKSNLLGTYKGHKIFGPYHGGITFTEMANILEGFKIYRFNHNSARSLHIMAETMRRAWVDRFRWHGDPEFEEVPLEGLASKEYAAEIRKVITERASINAIPGDPWRYEKDYSPNKNVGKKPSNFKEDRETTHMCAADDEHNMVTLTNTLGGIFGSYVTPKGTGIILRNYTNLFDTEPGRRNSLGPWKRPLSHHIPLIIYGKNDEPLFCIGAPGGRKVITAQLQVMINIIDYGMSMNEAINAPRIHCTGTDPSVPEGKLLKEILVDSRIPEKILIELEKMGHKIVPCKETINSYNFALPLGIMVNKHTKKLHSGVDAIRPAVAMGIDLRTQSQR